MLMCGQKALIKNTLYQTISVSRCVSQPSEKRKQRSVVDEAQHKPHNMPANFMRLLISRCFAEGQNPRNRDADADFDTSGKCVNVSGSQDIPENRSRASRTLPIRCGVRL